MSNRDRRRVVLVLSVLLLLALIFGLSHASRNPATPAPQSVTRENTRAISPGLAYIRERETAVLAMRRRAAELADQPASKVAGNKRFLVSEERRTMLEQITGMFVPPGLSMGPERDSFTLDEVVELYPILRGKDGKVNMEAALKIQALLGEQITRANERIKVAEAAGGLERLRPTEPHQMGSSPVEQISLLLASLETVPEHIYPTEALLRVIPESTNYSVLQMRSLLYRLATAQTDLEKGRPVDVIRLRLQRGPQRPRIPMTDEQADYLLATPLNQLATPNYVPAK